MKSNITIVTLTKTSRPRLGKTNLARIKKMTASERQANAKSDPDNLPLSHKDLLRFKKAKSIKTPDVKTIRLKLGVSQSVFAYYFGVSVRTLQDWEQHRHAPNKTVCNFLRVVAKEPKAVLRALSE